MGKMYGVNLVSGETRRFCDRVAEWQLACGNGITLRKRSARKVAELMSKMDALDLLKGSVHEDDIESKRADFRAQIEAEKVACREQCAAQAAFNLTQAEVECLDKLRKQSDNLEVKRNAVRTLFQTEYNMNVTTEWVDAIIRATGGVKRSSATRIVRTGSMSDSRTRKDVEGALFGWCADRMHECGMRKYLFADDICEMFAQRPKKVIKNN